MIRHRGRAAWLCGVGAFSTLLAISVKATPTDRPGDYEIGLALVAGCTLAAVWLSLIAARGVRIDGSGIVLRYCIKRRRLSLDSVRCFRMAEVRNPFGERVERAVIELRDGQLVLAPGLEPPMPFIRSSREDAVLAANQRLEQLLQES